MCECVIVCVRVCACVCVCVCVYACAYQCVRGGSRERISKTSTLRLERTKTATTEHRQVDRLATGDTTQAKMAQPLLLGLSAASGYVAWACIEGVDRV